LRLPLGATGYGLDTSSQFVIRPISIGKKNSLFSGDECGGETWAILASLLE